MLVGELASMTDVQNTKVYIDKASAGLPRSR